MQANLNILLDTWSIADDLLTLISLHNFRTSSRSTRKSWSSPGCFFFKKNLQLLLNDLASEGPTSVKYSFIMLAAIFWPNTNSPFWSFRVNNLDVPCFFLGINCCMSFQNFVESRWWSSRFSLIKSAFKFLMLMFTWLRASLTHSQSSGLLVLLAFLRSRSLSLIASRIHL